MLSKRFLYDNNMFIVSYLINCILLLFLKYCLVLIQVIMYRSIMYAYFVCINNAIFLERFHVCDSSSQCKYSNCDVINTILKMSSIISRCITYMPGIIFDSYLFILGLVFFVTYYLSLFFVCLFHALIHYVLSYIYYYLIYILCMPFYFA